MAEKKVTELTNNGIPSSWKMMKIQDLFEVETGSTPSTRVAGYWENGQIKWITPKDLGKLRSVYIYDVDRKITEKGLNSCSAKRIPPNSIIISTRAPIGYIAIFTDWMAFNQGCKGLVKRSEDINVEYFYYLLLTKIDEMNFLGSGSTFKEISKSQISNLTIPIPPLPEQHCIVAKIEELFTRLDAGVEALKKIKAQLKRYRQAVLKYAFEGKLTQEWREANKGKIEPASALLERIKEQRKKEAKGKVKELPPVDKSELPELPEGWVWTTVGAIYDIVGGGTPSTKIDKYWVGDIPWITSADIVDLKDIRPRRYINREAIQNSATNLVPAGSLIVVTRVGLGKITLTKTPLCFSQDSQALVGIDSQPYPDYSLYYLSQAVKIFKYQHRGTTIAGVTKKQLAELPFALPPLPEQHQIISEIENRLSIADNMEKVAEQSLKQSERLRQSILKRAFEGKLVPQDPTDEPAEKLLERIKEEKERMGLNKQKSKRKK